MNSKMTKLAVAASIVVAVLIGINLTGRSNVAFADILQPFLTARTATFKMIMEVQGVPTQSFDCMYAEPIRMRQVNHEQGAVVISNLQLGKIVTLNETQKQAILMEITNIPEDPGENQFNMFGEIRRHIEEAQDVPDDSVTLLGEHEIGGRTVVGYHVQKPGVDVTVWADRQTNLPVELKSVAGPVSYTMTDIVFDVDLDESLFDLTIPDDYQVVGTLYADATKPGEKDLVGMFRIWAEHTDGSLPTSVDMHATMAFVLARQTKMMQADREPSQDDALQLQQTLFDMGRGITFVQQLPADSDWHYAGKGVTFGAAGTPIFWYRPEGARTYRVIYADMTIDEVPASGVPTISDKNAASNDAPDGQALADEAVAMGTDIPPENRSMVARMLNLSEKGLIGGLRAFADLTGGRYPSKLDAKSTLKEVDTLKAEVLTDMSDEAKKEKTQDVFFATAYHDKLVRERKEVAYYGDTVRVTDSDKVLIRWRVADGQYRVVFGNLTARDVTAEELKGLEGR